MQTSHVQTSDSGPQGTSAWLTALRSPLLARPVAALLCGMLGGCLSTNFEVPRDELSRLTRVEPAQRGKQIRAFQRLEMAEDPPPAPEWAMPAAPTATAGLDAPVPESVPGGGYAPMAPYYWVDWGPPYYSPYWRSSSYYSTGTDYYGPGSLGGPGGGGMGSSMSAGKMARDDTKAAIAAVAAVVLLSGLILATSEAMRFDGWVGVHPHHPLHIKTKHGNWYVVAVDALTSEDVARADEAILVAREGNGLWLRGRAPLYRPGLTFRMQGGSFSQVMPGGEVLGGSGGDVGLGFFPTQELGLLGVAGFSVGGARGGDFVSIRTGAEAQFWPIQASRFNLGAYGGGGVDYLQSGDGLTETDDRFAYYDFGGAIEVELATRVAWLIRVGAHVTPGKIFDDRWALQIGLGVSIY